MFLAISFLWHIAVNTSLITFLKSGGLFGFFCFPGDIFVSLFTSKKNTNSYDRDTVYSRSKLVQTDSLTPVFLLAHLKWDTSFIASPLLTLGLYQFMYLFPYMCERIPRILFFLSRPVEMQSQQQLMLNSVAEVRGGYNT